MSAPLCGKRVRIVNTSQVELNGQEGVAGSFDHSKGRYQVQLTNNKLIALKPINLEPLPDASSGGGMPGFGGMPNFPGMAQNPQFAQAAQQVQVILANLQRCLPPGVGIQQLGGAILVIAVLLIYRCGFFKGLLISIAIGLTLLNGLPHFSRSGGGLPGIKAATRGLGGGIAGAIHQRTGFAATEVHGMIVFAFLAGVCLIYIVGPSFATPPPVPISEVQSEAEDPLETNSDISTLAQAYKRGFDSCKAGEPYRNPYETGASSGHSSSKAGGGPRLSPLSEPEPSGGGMGGMGKIIMMGMLGKQLYTLGGTPFSMATLMMNVQEMPVWKKGLFALAVYNLVSGGLF